MFLIYVFLKKKKKRVQHVLKEYPKSVSISTMLKLSTAISTTEKVPVLVEHLILENEIDDPNDI